MYKVYTLYVLIILWFRGRELGDDIEELVDTVAGEEMTKNMTGADLRKVLLFLDLTSLLPS